MTITLTPRQAASLRTLIEEGMELADESLESLERDSQDEEAKTKMRNLIADGQTFLDQLEQKEAQAARFLSPEDEEAEEGQRRCPRCGGGPGDPSCGKTIHETF